MQSVYLMYTNPKQLHVDAVGTEGLETVAARVDMPLLHPRRKVSVMIIGNHSAGTA
jgi:hypothetical protein